MRMVATFMLPQVQTDVFAKATEMYMAKFEDLIAGQNCRAGSGPNAIAAATQSAKYLAKSFAYGLAKAPYNVANSIGAPDVTDIEVSSFGSDIY